jgi:hypothetical protein
MGAITNKAKQLLGIGADAQGDRARANVEQLRSERAAIDAELASLQRAIDAADAQQAHDDAYAAFEAAETRHARKLSFLALQLPRAERELADAERAVALESLEAQAREASAAFNTVKTLADAVASAVAALLRAKAALDAAAVRADELRGQLRGRAAGLGVAVSIPDCDPGNLGFAQAKVKLFELSAPQVLFSFSWLDVPRSLSQALYEVRNALALPQCVDASYKEADQLKDALRLDGSYLAQLAKLERARLAPGEAHAKRIEAARIELAIEGEQDGSLRRSFGLSSEAVERRAAEMAKAEGAA